MVKIESNGSKYQVIRLNIFENLCSDVILRLNFQSQRQRLIFQLNGSSSDLLVSRESYCTLAAAYISSCLYCTTEVSLFSNLSSDIKPIVTRSCRYGQGDRTFIDIDENIQSLLMRT